jgi:hypothetical protein
MTQRTFSFAYNKYVNGDDEDLPGLIAYALYKRAKVAYLQAYKENNGKEATDKEIHNWSLDHSTPEKNELFRLQALRSVERYRQQEVKKAEPEIRKAIEAEHLVSIHAKVSSLTGAKAFWISVGAGVVASLILIPLAGLLYLGLRQSNPLGLVNDGPSGQPAKPVLQK